MTGSLSTPPIPEVAYGCAPTPRTGRSVFAVVGACIAGLLALVLAGMVALGFTGGDDEGLEQVETAQAATDDFLDAHGGKAYTPRFALDDPSAYLRLQSGWLLSQATDPQTQVIWSLTQGPRVATSPLDGSPVDDDRGACSQDLPANTECFQIPDHPTATVLVVRDRGGDTLFLTVRDNVSDTWFVEARTGLVEEDLPRMPAAYASAFLDQMATYRPGQFSAEEIFTALGGVLDS